MGNYVSITYDQKYFEPLLNLFSKSNEYDKDKILEAIDKFNITLNFLDNKINHMNNKINIYLCNANKFYKNNNKSSALYQLKLKKMYEKELQKMESVKFNIESNILHMESVTVMLEAFSTIKNTTSQIQIINKNLDISKVENIIEEICQQRDTTNDIENILTDNSIDEYDEDELLKELDSFNETDNKINETEDKIENELKFPSVPNHNINITNYKKSDILLKN